MSPPFYVYPAATVLLGACTIFVLGRSPGPGQVANADLIAQLAPGTQACSCIEVQLRKPFQDAGTRSSGAGSHAYIEMGIEIGQDRHQGKVVYTAAAFFHRQDSRHGWAGIFHASRQRDRVTLHIEDWHAAEHSRVDITLELKQRARVVMTDRLHPPLPARA